MMIKMQKQLVEITTAVKNLIAENLELREKIVELEALLATRATMAEQCGCSAIWAVDIHGKCSNCELPRR